MEQSKKSKIFMHIGIWKTGTTSIQKTLYQNRQLLNQNNIYYPEISENHTFLASAFHHAPEEMIVSKSMGLSGENLNQWHQESLNKFEKGIEAFDTAIVSSEFLLDLSSEKIIELKQYLEKFYKEVYVIVYIRHPINHISSAINEQIKQGHYGLSKAYEIHSHGWEYKKVYEWAKVYQEKLIMRPFEREQFLNHDIVDDFLSIVFNTEKIPLLEKLTQEQNKSLSYPAVLLADSLQKFAPSFSHQRAVTEYLFDIEGIPYTALKAVKEKLLANTEKYMTFFYNRYHLFFVNEYRVVDADIDCQDIWTEKTLLSLSKILNQYALEKTILESENARLEALLHQKEEKEIAEDYFKKSIKSGKNFAAFRDYAIFLKEAQRYEEALFYCNKAIMLQKDRPWLYELKNKILEAMV